MKKNIIYGIIGLIIVGGAAFMYFTRPVAAPSGTENTGELTTADGDIYRTNQTQSSATFTIDEILNNKPFTVVGTTNQVSGDIAVKDSVVTFGTFSINARTLKTDSERRDGAIARAILKSEQAENEFITFVPTSVSGDTNVIEDGKLHQMEVKGDLTISGVTKEAVFDVRVSRANDTLTGTAIGVVKRSDFGLVIPNIPFVAGVPDDFVISADIVANKVQ